MIIKLVIKIVMLVLAAAILLKISIFLISQVLIYREAKQEAENYLNRKYQDQNITFKAETAKKNWLFYSNQKYFDVKVKAYVGDETIPFWMWVDLDNMRFTDSLIYSKYNSDVKKEINKVVLEYFPNSAIGFEFSGLDIKQDRTRFIDNTFPTVISIFIGWNENWELENDDFISKSKEVAAKVHEINSKVRFFMFSYSSPKQLKHSLEFNSEEITMPNQTFQSRIKVYSINK